LLKKIVSILVMVVMTPAPDPAPAPDYDIGDKEFGVIGFSGVTPPEPPVEIAAEPSPPTISTPAEARAEPRASRADDRAPASQADTPEVGMARSGVLGVAAQYVGSPYVLGGTSPAGFDCSGFTSYVYGKIGVSLPRTAAQQQAAVTPVSDPRPGDLVFWGSPAWHVGIYAGDGMVYDAGSPATGVVYRTVFSGVTGYGRVN
jgi:cell wall-associated NlpC family hydrolase